jgi:CubicO group peptidase (beta-lactamase class C family)
MNPTQRTACIAAAAAVAALAAAGAGAQTPAAAAPVPALPSDAEIRALLADRVDVQRKSVGMVVGIVTPRERRIVGYGRLALDDPRIPDGGTVFEIGSVTKVFTSLLLADMARRGEVALTDPVARYLPAGTKLPERNGKPITLADLATHTSGLPFAPPDPPDAAAYGEEQLFRFLAAYELPGEPGSRWAYSNLGAGLLGIALARRAGVDYEALVRARITGPLGMRSTAVAVSPEMRERMAAGHDATLRPAREWLLAGLPGAGSLRSSADDLLTLLGAFLGHARTPLAPAMASMLHTRRPGPSFEQALGWWVVPLGPGDEGIVTHGGSTFGYSATVAYDPRAGVGVVVLSNGVENDGGLAWHLLRPAFPYATSAAARAREERGAVAVAPELLGRYSGRYRTPDGGAIDVERQGDSLVLRSPAAPQGVRLHAESERAFFIREADLRVTFETDAQGRATGLVVHFAGTDTRAPRVAGP